jgi:hypothetical protein
MGFYNDFILPRLLDLAMSKQLLPFRERLCRKLARLFALVASTGVTDD